MKPVQVAVVMGSNSDYPTMVHASEILKKLGVPYIERVRSAHRGSKLLREFVSGAYERGIRVVIAGAGGSAALPGNIAAEDGLLLVLGVPCPSSTSVLNDVAAVFSMAFMPGGVSVATESIGKAGAINAALDAAKFVAAGDPEIARNLRRFFAEQTASVPDKPSLPKPKRKKRKKKK